MTIQTILCVPLQAAEPQVKGTEHEFFEQKIRPALVEHCYACHSAAAAKADKLRGGLMLDTRAGWQKGGDNGPSIVPKKPKESLLIKALQYEGDTHMPPTGKLPASVIADFVKWVEAGANDPRDGTTGVTKKEIDIAAGRKYWAFQPLSNPTVPTVKNEAWSKREIDRFLLAKMTEKGVTPTLGADRTALVRRVYFDVIGLPPTPEEVAAFVNDQSNNAYEKLIDKLLASQHYGERWARHWLDPARYAESTGFEHDYVRPNAYHYRDFVIKALNGNMPYNQFVQWQIAGDELAPGDPLALAATGFLGAGVFPTQITTSEAERVRYDAMDDMLSTTGSSIMGLTVGCARCHDHKFDPIPTKDYYRMLAAFTTTVRAEIDVVLGTPAEKEAMAKFDAKRKVMADALTAYEGDGLSKALDLWVKQQKEAKKEQPKIADMNAVKGLASVWEGKSALIKLPKAQRDALVKWFAPQDVQHKKLKKELDDLDKTAPKVERIKIQATTEGQKPMRHHTSDVSIPDFYADTYVLKRGDVVQKDGKADVGMLQVLHRDGVEWKVEKPSSASTTYKRATLAKWLTDTKGGAGALTARVYVNRIWHHHFGRGIVSTVNDFGMQGEKPTHPELLEWLANDFATHGWDIKRLHKQILMTEAYQLGGGPNEANQKLDPDNKLYWLRPKRRLEAEAVRDNLLSVAGMLDKTMYGPGTLDESMKRRSIYFQIRRSQLIPMLQVYDWPDTLSSCGVRSTTTVAPQALLFLNNAQVKAAASAIADQLMKDKESNDAQLIIAAYQRILGRGAGKSELNLGVEFLNAHKDRKKAIQDYVHALLGLNEFIYVD